MLAMSWAALPWKIECHSSFLFCSRLSTYTVSNNGHNTVKKLINVPLFPSCIHATGFEYTLFAKISVGRRQNRCFQFLAGVELLYDLRLRCNSFRYRTNPALLAFALKLSTRAWLVPAKARLNVTYLGSPFSLRKIVLTFSRYSVTPFSPSWLTNRWWKWMRWWSIFISERDLGGLI